MAQVSKEQIDSLYKKVQQIENAIRSVKESVRLLSENADRPDYSQVDGILGVFDGEFMVASSGEKIPIPTNYSAKSKLVYGDTLKLIEEDGKKLFKHVNKVERIKVEGILTKKEGEWYLLTDRGSYKVSDTAAEYQKAQLNSEVSAFLPADKLDAPFATIDQVAGFDQSKSYPAEKPVIKEKTVKPVEPKTEKKLPNSNVATEGQIELNSKKTTVKKPPVKTKPKTEAKPQFEAKPKTEAKPRTEFKPKTAPKQKIEVESLAQKPVVTPEEKPQVTTSTESKNVDIDDLM